ncbi:MAG: hypothetical protein WDO73_09850 [Ignavibacteriota bacterium]
MQSLEYIKTRATMPGLKGRIIDYKDGDIITTDEKGTVIARGFTVKLTGTSTVQPCPDQAPVKMATLKVTRATPNGERETYNILRPMRDLFENLPDVLLKGVGEDVQFEKNDPYAKLLLVILSSSTPGTAEYAPTYNTSHFADGGNWYYASDAEVGKQGVALVANAEIEIVREIKNEETGESAFRLRCPRVDGSGFDFCTVPYSDFQMGQGISFPARAVSIHNSAKLGLCLGARFAATTAADRLELERTEREQPQRDAQARLEEQYSKGAPLYSAPHYKTRGM